MRLVCSDLDGTLLGEPDATAEFLSGWEGLGAGRPVLVYSTGRLLGDAMHVVRHGGLPEPDFFIGGVGTMIHEVGSGELLHEFSAMLDEDWDRARVHRLVQGMEAIEVQPEHQQHEWKSSWYWHDATPAQIEELRGLLAAEGLVAQVIYSSARDLDVLPRAANKGNALRWLCRRLGIGHDEVVVAGDTGNDASMFLVPGVRGIAVGNAEPELLEAIREADAHVAEGTCAGGVIEGLLEFGVFPRTATED